MKKRLMRERRMKKRRMKDEELVADAGTTLPSFMYDAENQEEDQCTWHQGVCPNDVSSRGPLVLVCWCAGVLVCRCVGAVASLSLCLLASFGFLLNSA